MLRPSSFLRWPFVLVRVEVGKTESTLVILEQKWILIHGRGTSLVAVGSG